MGTSRKIKKQQSLSHLCKKLALPVLGVCFSLGLTSKASAATVEYTCNEGIPLIVEYLEENDVSIAKISHDSSPKITLVSVRAGSGSKYSNGNWVLHVKGKTALVGTQGEFDDQCTEVENSTHNHQPHAPAITFPRQARSWGGIVRSGPGQHYKKRASLREGEWITLLEKTGEMFQDRPWFKIKYRGRIGYHWGGIVCSVGTYVEGTYQVCN
ncbi:MAG: MliC family protein [Rhodomicrobiaceae bacterium]